MGQPSSPATASPTCGRPLGWTSPQARPADARRTPGCWHSPMKDTALVLMMPLGNRWKSYSLPSTTTVWPALLPPYEQKSR